MAGPTTQARLKKAVTPRPWTAQRHFAHVEVHKAKQVLLLVGKLGEVQRAIHVSTAAPGHVTPTGHWHVYSKSPMSWSNLFHVWLPWASYVVGGDRDALVRERARLPGLARLHPHARAGGQVDVQAGPRSARRSGST